MKLFSLVFITLTAASSCVAAQNTYPFPQSGNVGIGTTSPVTPLEVIGSVTVAGNNANLDNRNGNLPLSFLENSGKMIVGWDRSRGAGETSFIANQSAGWGGGFAFYNHDNNGLETQLMYVRGDGTLGIGTDDTKGYRLAVNGKIIGTEVVVKTYGSWPDYVFKPAYRLLALSSVKSFIDRNGHLPEMPSATEVEKQGVSLGEMNRLLVKKIEELTLYLIELKKDNEDLTKRVKKLENRK